MSAGDHMGFERPRAEKFVRVPVPVYRHGRHLSDYGQLTISDPYWSRLADVEAEQCTWPEMVDQTRLAYWCGRYAFDDAEEDDWPGGDVCDEPHDPLEEDGI